MFPHNRVREVEEMALHVTIPLLDASANGFKLLGTGTLFCIENRYFIITARHIFRDEQTNEDITNHINLACPVESPIKSELFVVGDFTKYCDDTNESLDVALLELKSEETIRRLKNGWRFMGVADICIPSKSGIFFVTGFPLSNTTKNVDGIYGKLTTIYSPRLLDAPRGADQPVDMEIDLFFAYKRTAEARDGKIVPAPELEGMSGAPVWEYFPTTRIVTFKPQIAMVGIQSAYYHSRYFRAKSWWIVAAILRAIDQSLAERLKVILDGK